MTILWNQSDKDPRMSLTNGGATASGTGWGSVRATQAQSAGRLHVEWVLSVNVINGAFIGFLDAAAPLSSYPGSIGNAVGVELTGASVNVAPYMSGFFHIVNQISGPVAQGDVFSADVDFTAGEIRLKRNGSPYGSVWATFTPGSAIYPATALYEAQNACTLHADTVNQQFPTQGYSPWAGGSPPPPPPLGQGDYSAFPNSSTTPRQRVLGGTAVVYVDWLAGNDANDGSTPTLAVKNMQTAVNIAQDRFDTVSNPSTWFDIGNSVYRPGVTVQLAPAPAATPYELPQPLSMAGMGPAGVITLRGGAAPSLATASQYCVHASNSLQALAPQDGAVLIADGFTITGAPNCTLLNPLAGGRLAHKNMRLGSAIAGQLAAAAGAADGGRLDQIGSLNIFGPGFLSVFEAVTLSSMSFTSDPTTIENAMNFGIMMVLDHSEATCEASHPAWNNAVGAVGQNYVVQHASFLGFDHAAIPGSGGVVDGTSVVL